MNQLEREVKNSEHHWKFSSSLKDCWRATVLRPRMLTFLLRSRFRRQYTFFYRQLNFASEPGVANEILENEPKSCLTVA